MDPEALPNGWRLVELKKLKIFVLPMSQNVLHSEMQLESKQTLRKRDCFIHILPICISK